MNEMRQRLLQLLREKSLKIGRFRLVSGMTSHYYFDSKLTTLDPEGGYLTARLLLEEIKVRGIRASAIGGLTLGADPIVSAVSALSFAEREHFAPISAFIVRKESKRHGTQQFIEGFMAEKGSDRLQDLRISLEAKWQPEGNWVKVLMEKRSFVTEQEFKAIEGALKGQYDKFGVKAPHYVTGEPIIQVPGTIH